MSADTSPLRKHWLPGDDASPTSLDQACASNHRGPTRQHLEVQIIANSSTDSTLQASANDEARSSVASNSPSKATSPANGHEAAKNGPPAKRRKITAAEREERRKEKRRKDQLKAAERAEKEQEKRDKEEEKRKRDEERDEEKRKREEEREEKRRVRELEISKKEAERKLKDEERQRKDEEREKKERAQMRLNSFFVKPSESSAEPSSGASQSNFQGGKDHLEPQAAPAEDNTIRARSSTSNTTSPLKAAVSSFEQNFPPFFMQSYVTLATRNRFLKRRKSLGKSEENIDIHLRRNETNDHDEVPHTDPSQYSRLDQAFPNKRRKIVREPQYSTREIVAKIQGSTSHPIDLTESNSKQPEELLATLPIKYLRFAEDVRPSYRGTFARNDTQYKSSSLRKRPFKRELPDIDYDYDSEAEWEEPDPEDGEDLASEGDEEVGSEDGGDEMEDFLDDEDMGDGLNAPGAKRRNIVGDMEPVSSGLRWENEAGRLPASDQMDLKPYRLEIISEAIQGPIDPFSTRYWLKASQISDAPTESSTKGATAKNAQSNMNPPRVPLHAVNRSNVAINNQLQLVDSKGTLVKPTKTMSGIAPPSKFIKGQIEGDDLEEFKKAVEGSDMTKLGLIEVLKKQFPKTSKDVIKNTLAATAARVGTKEVEKRWALLEGV